MKFTDKLDRESNRDFAHRVIRQNIINLELQPGCMISEQDLADELAISRTPVHEALQEISKTKIIEIYPQKGSLVSLIDMKLVSEARFVRATLESVITEMACEMATPEQLQELEENVNLQEFYLKKQVNEKIMELDNSFHEMMYKIADKEQTYYMVKTMNVHYDRFRELRLKASPSQPIIEDHKLILDAMLAKDGTTAKELVIKHLSKLNDEAVDIRKKFPQYFL